ncbi:MAG: ABC transporter permease [Candidatus Micrarchaeota archaeon]|nr:ABC transporter permease [Candidatus Micrarchaeota archaeon]
METNAIYTLWLREMKRFLRSKSRIVGNLSMPFIWLAILGVGLNTSFAIPGIQSNYLEFMAPGIIVMSLLFTSIFSGVSVIWDKQFGFLKEILVAPVSRTSIVVGKILGSTTISLINALLVLAMALLLGALPVSSLTPISLAAALVIMALVSISFVSFGLAIASTMNNMEGFQMIMSFLVMPIFFLSGAFFPLDKVPDWMKVLTHLDPLMYGVDGLRGAFIGVSQFPVLFDIGILAAFSALMILVSSYLFSRMGG